LIKIALEMFLKDFNLINPIYKIVKYH
jgi:hypothetical protein